MAKKRGLGRGLSALITSTEEGLTDSPHPKSGLTQLPVEQVIPNPYQPRDYFDPDKLQELADSIREHGLIQPLVVSKTESGDYHLIAGERRWRASRMAGLSNVPVVIKEVSPQEMLELALIENIQRDDLNPLEEALAYNQLMQEFGLTQEMVAERVGRSRSAVANTVRLLNLPEEAKQALLERKISAGHARALLSLNAPEQQLSALQYIVEMGLNVRQTEALVKRVAQTDPMNVSASKSPQLSVQDKRILGQFEARLGTKVDLSRSGDKGKLVIHFFSEEELQAIYGLIVGSDEL